MGKESNKKPKAKADADKDVAMINAPIATRDEERKASVSQSDRWENSFKRLKVFRKKYGHCAVPFRYPSDASLGYPSDASLGRWVAFQRTMYKNMCGGKSQHISLTPERIRRLESIGFEWILMGTKGDSAWDVRYASLVKFTHLYHHCQVPIGWEPNPQLATWVSTQRRQARLFREGHCAEITQEQIAKLTNLGIVWEDKTQADANDRVPPRLSDFAHGNGLPSGMLVSDAAMIFPQSLSLGGVTSSSAGGLHSVQQHIAPRSLPPALSMVPDLTSLGTLPWVNSYPSASSASRNLMASITNVPLPLHLEAMSPVLSSLYRLGATYPPYAGVVSQQPLNMWRNAPVESQGNLLHNNRVSYSIPTASSIILPNSNSGIILPLVPSIITALLVASQARNAPLSIGDTSNAPAFANLCFERLGGEGIERTVESNDDSDSD